MVQTETGYFHIKIGWDGNPYEQGNGEKRGKAEEYQYIKEETEKDINI